ncbi:MAG: hypothetical protein K0R14_1965 [Burkholderiales bacterium]|jgi:hypothetical protein|nr:hypothetical protein [Burkholderiales bacterium]
MSFIYDPNHVMFYQDDLVISYKDFLLITKYFEERFFQDINLKKVAIILPDGIVPFITLISRLGKQ